MKEKLSTRKQEGLYRSLRNYSHLIDFSSNDYLGLARQIENIQVSDVGATGSRLISGNHDKVVELERFLAGFHGFESALVFNSGYVANQGLLSTIPQRGDTIIYDELIHASIRDGIRLSYANSYVFKHNDLDELRNKIKKATGNIFVVVESVYSMDGDSPDLKKIVRICNEMNAHLIVDEAHAVGVVGEKGAGLVTHLNLQKDVFAVVVTFGKALGCHGAAVLCSELTKDYLINFSRQFIYTTAPSEQTALTILEQYTRMQNVTEARNFGGVLKSILVDKLSGKYKMIYGEFGNIVSVIIPGNENVKTKAELLEKNGFFVKPILSPTVKNGQERLRICFHSFNTTEQVEKLVELLKSY